jgi:hypothetical protein
MTSRRHRRRPNSIGGQFAAHLIDMIESPAWRALSLSARRCLERIEIEMAHHGGRSNGELPVTNRDFRAYGVPTAMIKPALAELVALGFITMTPGHASLSPDYGRAARFRLLFRTGIDGPPEEHRWKRFKTDVEAKLAAKAARASAMRKRHTKASANASPYASQGEALASASESEALGASRKVKHYPPARSEALSTVSAAGRSRRPAAASTAPPAAAASRSAEPERSTMPVADRAAATMLAEEAEPSQWPDGLP